MDTHHFLGVDPIAFELEELQALCGEENHASWGLICKGRILQFGKVQRDTQYFVSLRQMEDVWPYHAPDVVSFGDTHVVCGIISLDPIEFLFVPWSGVTDLRDLIRLVFDNNEVPITH